jgi:hypothetical protein
MRLLLVFVLALPLLACSSEKSKKDDPAEDKVQPMTDTEIDRGNDACTTYVERLCKCVGAQPKLAEACEKERAIVSSFRMLVQMNRTGQATDDERIVSAQKARETISKCVTETAKLEARGCE